MFRCFRNSHGCIRAWESLGIRVLREHEIAGSNPAVLTLIDCGKSFVPVRRTTPNNVVRHPIQTPGLVRWGLCWYGPAAVNRLDAGSIPAAAASVERGEARAARQDDDCACLSAPGSQLNGSHPAG